MNSLQNYKFEVTSELRDNKALTLPTLVNKLRNVVQTRDLLVDYGFAFQTHELAIDFIMSVMEAYYGRAVTGAIRQAINGEKIEDMYIEDMDLPAMMITFHKSRDTGALMPSYGMKYTDPYKCVVGRNPILPIPTPNGSGTMSPLSSIGMSKPRVTSTTHMLPYFHASDELWGQDVKMCIICDDTATVVNIFGVDIIRAYNGVYYFSINVDPSGLPQQDGEDPKESLRLLAKTMSRAVIETDTGVIHECIHIEVGPLNRNVLRGTIGPAPLLVGLMATTVARQYLSMISQAATTDTIRITRGDGARGAVNGSSLFMAGLAGNRQGGAIASANDAVNELAKPHNASMLTGLLTYAGFVNQRSILTNSLIGTIASPTSIGAPTPEQQAESRQILSNLGGVYLNDVVNVQRSDSNAAHTQLHKAMMNSMLATFDSFLEKVSSSPQHVQDLATRKALLEALNMLD